MSISEITSEPKKIKPDIYSPKIVTFPPEMAGGYSIV